VYEEVGVLGHLRSGLGRGEGLDALVGLEVVPDPEALAGRVDLQVRVRAEAVHVPPRARGVPRSVNRKVTWCADSGLSVQKSHCMSLSRSPVSGWRFCERMKCGNFMGSRMKKIGVLPTRS